MYKIVKKELLAPNIYLMNIEAPRVGPLGPAGTVRHRPAGRARRTRSADYFRLRCRAGVGDDRHADGRLFHFEAVRDERGRLAGRFRRSLGCPSEFVHEEPEALRRRRILFVAGGVGTAPVYPQVKWLSERGVKADVIIGAKNKDTLILTDKMRAVAGEVFIATDDGQRRISRYGDRPDARPDRPAGQALRRSDRDRPDDHDEVRRPDDEGVRPSGRSSASIR